MPKLSVVIPTRNRASLLPQAVESAWSAGTDLEIIVVDNASDDDTPEICANLPNIRYIRLDQNSGEGGARNVGIHASRSEYVAFLDDDDLRLPGSLDRQCEVLRANPQAALVYGPVLIGDEDCRPTGERYPDSRPTGDVFWKLLAFNFIPLPSVVARKQALIASGLFESGLKAARDYDLWLRVTEKFEVAAVDDPVAIYRRWTISGKQMSANLPRQYAASAAVQAGGLRLGRAREGSRATRRRLRGQYLRVVSDSLLYEAVVALRRDDLRVAFANAAAALRFQPSRIARPEHWRGLIFSSIELLNRRRHKLFPELPAERTK